MCPYLDDNVFCTRMTPCQTGEEDISFKAVVDHVLIGGMFSVGNPENHRIAFPYWRSHFR
jgi:hypothetical protein